MYIFNSHFLFLELQYCIPNCLSSISICILNNLKFHKLLIFLFNPLLPVVFPISANANPFCPVTQTKKLKVVLVSPLSLSPASTALTNSVGSCKYIW